MASTDKHNRDSGNAWHGTDVTPISLLENIRRHGKAWEELAEKYGVANPDPPWRITLEATCDMLAAESCVIPYDQVKPGSCAIPSLERRAEEDDLSETIYANVPFPERQLLALAHSMIRRGLFNEDELAEKMKNVHERLTSA